MANNPAHPPNSNLADILRTLSALAPQNQEQPKSQTPDSRNHGLPLRGPEDYHTQPSNDGQYGANQQQQQQQPWQPANQPWRPPSQTPWQPPQQQAWQPPQQVVNQQSYQQSTTPPPQQYHQQQQQPFQNQPQAAMHQPKMQMAHQPMPDPRHAQMAQMSDPHHLQRMKEKEMQRQRGVDPATIIDWPTGLRCVMKTVAMNEKFIGEIKKLIQVQNAHEMQWYAGRKALMMKAADRAAARKVNQKKLNSILQSVGGTLTDSSKTPDPTPEQEAEALKTELEVFDAKVYRAQHQMCKEMTGKLRSLGVPFFGTRSELVVLKNRSKESTPVDGKAEGAKKEGEGQKGKISEMELVELQRKMLRILEDLCEER